MATFVEAPANYFEPITPSDTVDQPAYTSKGRLTDAIYIGGTGDLSIVMQNGAVLTASFKGLPVGTMIKVAARRVNASGTSATQLTACYVI